MIETAEPTFQAESNLRAWLVTFLLAAGAVIGYQAWTRVAPYQAPALAPEGARWFLLLKMPESPVDKAGQRAAVRRLELWLEALRAADFHPMRLADVVQRLSRGETLPRKTVVLLYDPGYLCTYQAVAPVLARHQVPALWVTSGRALKGADRRFLSYHELRKMKASGRWDIALFSGESSLATGSRLYSWDPSMAGAWRMENSRRAVNWFSANHHLGRLSVNPQWTPQQFVNRLFSDVPVEGPVTLTMRTINNKAWGIALAPQETTDKIPTTFSLEPRRFRRSASVEWLGTSGLKNFDLEIGVTGLTGDLHALLRADRDAGESLHVGIARDQIWVDQERDGIQTRLASCPWARPPLRPFHISLILAGKNLRVSVDHKPFLALHTLQPARSERGDVLIEVAHRLRGVAQVRSLEVSLTPWRK